MKFLHCGKKCYAKLLKARTMPLYLTSLVLHMIYNFQPLLDGKDLDIDVDSTADSDNESEYDDEDDDPFSNIPPRYVPFL